MMRHEVIFHKSGYAVFDDVVDGLGCDELIAALPQVDTCGSRVLLALEIFRDLAKQLRTKVLSRFAGDLVAVQCTFFRKSLERNWGVHLHRDGVVPIQGKGQWKSAGMKEGLETAHPPRAFLDRCIAIRMHLDGALTEDISVIPGSHLDSENHERAKAIPIPVPRGGVLVMRPTLAHASGRLHEASHRRVLHYLFAPMRVPEGYSWYDVV